MVKYFEKQTAGYIKIPGVCKEATERVVRYIA